MKCAVQDSFVLPPRGKWPLFLFCYSGNYSNLTSPKYCSYCWAQRLHNKSSAALEVRVN